MQSSIPTNLTHLSRQERLRIWMQRKGITFTALARELDVTPNAVSKLCHQSTMPTRRHAALLDLGVSVELLPTPCDLKTGPKPRVQQSQPE